MAFPADFVWGAATSSYQIEGGGLSAGRGESIWDRFSHTPGKVLHGHHGDVACDHLHRYRDDVALMAALGLKAYRFSTAWPRVLPQGTGPVNPAGIDFYSRLVDELLKHNITPYLTLYHWDLPQALQERGGWENRDSLAWFTEYAALMTERLGDRVKHWTTLNEPWVVAMMGNDIGIHAPGKTDLRAALSVAHHIMLAHGAAVPVIRQQVAAANVGITVDLAAFHPATASPADHAAAEREAAAKNTWFLDAIFKGSYPAELVTWLGPLLDEIDLSEARAIAAPIDFLGINYYTRTTIAHSPEGVLQSTAVRRPNVERTAFDWEVYPDGLRELLVWVNTTYQPQAIYITENGAAYDDPPPTDRSEVVEDPQRVAYYQQHWAACEQALAAGVPLKGYFAWSLLDNFEWAMGYTLRFGLVYVDYPTQRRILKRSALALRDQMRQGS